MEATSSTTLADVGDGIVLQGKRRPGADKGAQLQKRKIGGPPPFAGADVAAKKEPKRGDGGKRRKRDQVMSDVASVLGAVGPSACSGQPVPKTPRSSPGKTGAKSSRSGASVVNLDDSDVDDGEGGIDIQLILQGHKLGRSVRSVFFCVMLKWSFFFVLGVQPKCSRGGVQTVCTPPPRLHFGCTRKNYTRNFPQHL